MRSMNGYRYYHPIEVRYGDLDPQGHVNNARYLTYLEQARIGYIRHLGLWRGGSFLDIGIILAEARVTFRQPIHLGQAVRVGVRVPRLGNKSFPMQYVIEDARTGAVLAAGETVQVCYDYATQRTISIPPSWRAAIALFEGLAEEQGHVTSTR